MPSVTVSRGSKPTQAFVLYDELGAAIDLTGATLKFAVKRDIEDADSLAVCNITATPDGDQVTNKGKYTLTFALGQTSIASGNYPAALRVWTGGSTARPPDRVESSSYTVLDAVIAIET